MRFLQGLRPVQRIGFLGLESSQTDSPFFTAVRSGMLELRRVEGRDYVIGAGDRGGGSTNRPARDALGAEPARRP